MSFFTGSQSNSERVHRLRILVVDDDMMSQYLMRVLLTREGYEVEVASNGWDALEAIKYQQFDIVFMDLQMPGLDGLEASRRIREWENGRQRTFIVALTAGYFADQNQGLFEAGMDSYIPKPFEVQQLQRVLKQRADIYPYPSREVPPA